MSSSLYGSDPHSRAQGHLDDVKAPPESSSVNRVYRKSMPMARQLGRTYLPDIVEPGKLASERAPSLGCYLLCNVHNFISSPGKGGGGGGSLCGIFDHALHT